jgi:uncharacterized SAM-binding protein YcdF (DUF218 family)
MRKSQTRLKIFLMALMISRLLSALRLAVFALGTLLLIITFTPLVPWTAALLATDGDDRDGDVLIVLNGATVTLSGLPSGEALGLNSYWRTLYAVHAWRRGHFRAILLSGAGTRETIKPLLIAYGVPESAIMIEDRSTNTRESALFAGPVLQNSRNERLVLLTSDYHSFRAARCFARANITVHSRPCPDVLKAANSRVQRWQCAWTLAVELAKIGYYWARDWI